MARPSESGSSWLASLVGAAVLICGGFAFGLIVGVVSEEPELVAGEMIRDAEEVDWSAGSGAPPAGVSAGGPGHAGIAAARDGGAPSAGAPERPGAAAGESPRTLARGVQEGSAARVVEEPPVLGSASDEGSAPVAPSPAVSAPPPGDGWTVQVGAFSDEEAATQLVSRLQDSGFPAYVRAATGSAAARWRVRVGPLPSRGEAEAMGARLEAEQELPIWVLSEAR